jgi:hypothetical protein
LFGHISILSGFVLRAFEHGRRGVELHTVIERGLRNLAIIRAARLEKFAILKAKANVAMISFLICDHRNQRTVMFVFLDSGHVFILSGFSSKIKRLIAEPSDCAGGHMQSRQNRVHVM